MTEIKLHYGTEIDPRLGNVGEQEMTWLRVQWCIIMERNVQMTFPQANVRVDYTPLHVIPPDAHIEVLGVDAQTSATVRAMIGQIEVQSGGIVPPRHP
ncbi:MAG: hypothetical protein H0X24_00700 [Ktedonobacterales bacterium]|nr:hypothetical protein [Ktedonobacterales bacterium]